MKKKEFKEMLNCQLDNRLYDRGLEATDESSALYVDSLTDIICNYIKLLNVIDFNIIILCVGRIESYNHWYIEGKINLMVTFNVGSFFNGDFNLYLVQKEDK